MEIFCTLCDLSHLIGEAYTNQTSMGAKRHTELNGLTVQEEKMCQLYVNGPKHLTGNQTACWLKVYAHEKNNYKNSSKWSLACQKFSQKHIKERIKELLSVLDEEWVKNRLFKEANEAEYARDRLKAVELVGKTKAMFIEKQQFQAKIDLITLEEEEFPENT